MMASPYHSSIDAFLASLSRSGLIDQPQLVSVVADFYSETRHAYGNSLTSLVSWLIERRYLTEWQVTKLRQNKYKGFVLDSFVLLDVLETDPSVNFKRYLARDTRRNTLVSIKVFAPEKRSVEGIVYEIEGDFA